MRRIPVSRRGSLLEEDAVIRRLLGGRVKSDYQISYYRGSAIRRVERGRRVEWFLDGAPVSEAEARAYMASQESPS